MDPENDKKKKPTQRGDSKNIKRPCPICGKMIANVSRHFPIHSQVKKHKCSHCNNSATRPDYLLLHISKMHNGKKRFHCHLCSKKYATAHTLKEHVNGHSFEECRVCFKMIRLTYFRRHTLSHNKSFECPHCSLKFATKTIRRVHLKEKHTNNEQPAFSYSHCTDQFMSANALSMHLRMRHSETLPACPHKRFCVLNVSITTVPLTKSMSCGFCKRKFATFASLHVHQTTDCNKNDACSNETAQVVCALPTLPTFNDSSVPSTYTTTVDELSTPTSDISEVATASLQRSQSQNNALNTPPRDHVPENAEFVPCFCSTCGLRLKSKEIYENHLPCLDDE